MYHKNLKPVPLDKIAKETILSYGNNQSPDLGGVFPSPCAC